MEESEECLLIHARHGHDEAVEQILHAVSNGSLSLDINCKGRSKHFLDQTALHLATYFGHVRVVQLLLDHGADINAVNSCGDTALHKAALIGNEELVLLLLERGASVKTINGAGETAVQAAAGSAYIQSLLQAASHTDRRKQHDSLLRAATQGDTVTMTALLKERDAPNINCTDLQGNTCLHVAAYRDHEAVAVLLLENGVDTSVKNYQGQLAVDLSCSDRMRKLLSVTPVRQLQMTAVRCEGPLVRRYRFTGWKPVWAVLERGVLTYFGSRGDATSAVRRKDFKYLDGACVTAASERADGAVLVLRFSDDSMHRLKCEPDDPVTRQKWVNAFQQHIDFSTHYIKQGLGLAEEQDEDQIKPLGSMQDAMQSARAKQQLLREHVQNVASSLHALHDCDQQVEPATGLIEKLDIVGEVAVDMMTSLSHCLTLFTQQEELRQLQLRQQRERCRVLQQSLLVLAEQHQQLEMSLACSGGAASGGGDGAATTGHHHVAAATTATPADFSMVSEDEFFDAEHDVCDEDDDATLVSCSTPTELSDDDIDDVTQCATPTELSDDVISVSSMSVVSSEGGRYRRPRAGQLSTSVTRQGRTSSSHREPGQFALHTRTHLPREQISSDDFSIWSVLKTAIGRELTKIPMPVVFNEPLSFLQRMAEFMEYSPILDMAAAQTDSITRMEYVAAFAVSGLASNWQRVGKPFNPLLGETYELNRNNYWFVSEQVSHHPPISAFHAESKQFRFHGSIHPKLKFWGRSVEIQPRGVLSVELPQYDEVYTWSNVNCCVHNVIVGKLWIEQYGTMSITNHRTGEQCTLLFKPAGWFSKELHRLEGFIVDKAKVRRRFLYGRWTDFIRSTDIHSFEAYEKQNSSKFKLSSVDCSASKPTHSPAHSPRRVLSKLNSLSTPFRSHTESTAGDLLNVDESTPAEYRSTGESGGEVPLSLSAYSIDIPNSVTLWQAAARPAHSAKYYHFTWLAMSLNQRTSDLQSLCPTDSRLRPDILALEEGNIDLAAGEKNRLEEKQREARKLSHKQQRCWTARFFKLTSNPHVKSDDWMYLGNYWHDRQAAGPDIF